jgi:hypothetical protein
MTTVTVAEPAAVWWVGFPLLGGGAGWLVNIGLDWLVRLHRIPFGVVVRPLASVPEPAATIGAIVLGGLAGLWLATTASAESLTVVVDLNQVVLRRGAKVRPPVPRSAVGAVFLDGKHLVLLDRAGEELIREPSALDRRRLRDAFRCAGYPWHDTHPPSLPYGHS